VYSPLTQILIIFTALFPSPDRSQGEAVLVGCGGRAIERSAYEETLSLIRYRIETRRTIEPLLILSFNGDSDILGMIAVDESLPLAEREVAANAILDQLFVADPYFQGCADYYLNTLAYAQERSLRFKGAVGLAILEHRYFLSGGRAEQRRPALYELYYAAMREPDPESRTAMRALFEGDPSDLLADLTDVENSMAGVPYRRFDSVPMPPLMEEDQRESPVSQGWQLMRWAVELNSRLESGANGGESGEEAKVFDEINKATPQQVRAFLARFRVSVPVEEGGINISYVPLLDFFTNMAVWSKDPYIRSLSFGPVAAGPGDRASEFLVDRMVNDDAPLTRMAAADMMKGFCGSAEVRQRMIAAFRREGDARVKLRMLHSLVWPFGDQPPPDIQAFLLGRLRDQQDKKLLGYIVAVLGAARVRSASEPLTELARSTSDPLLRRRIEDALRTIRGRLNN
jgi:hypothetical protein